MPFNPINFAGIEPQGNPMMANLVQNLMKGYQMGQMPGQMRRQGEQEELANALNRMKVQNYPEESRIAQALQKAQAEKLEREAKAPSSVFDAFKNLPPGIAGQVLSEDLIKRTRPDLISALSEAHQKEKIKGFGGAALKEQEFFNDQIQSANPNLQGEKLVEAQNRALNGADKLSDGTPINIPQQAQLGRDRLYKLGTTAQQLNYMISGQQAEAELDTMKPYIQKGFEHYGDTIFGQSPELTKDTLKAKNGDKSAQKRIGEFLAGQTLQLESAQIQQRMNTGKVTVAATQEMLQRSSSKIGGNFDTLTKESQKIAIDTVIEAVKKGFAARQKVGIGAAKAFGIGSPVTAGAEAEEDFDIDLSKYGGKK